MAPLVEMIKPPALMVMTLDGAARHRWSPIAPCARIEVALDRPASRWSGVAYCDTNEGDAPLEAEDKPGGRSPNALPGPGTAAGGRRESGMR